MCESDRRDMTNRPDDEPMREYRKQVEALHKKARTICQEADSDALDQLREADPECVATAGLQLAAAVCLRLVRLLEACVGEHLVVVNETGSYLYIKFRLALLSLLEERSDTKALVDRCKVLFPVSLHPVEVDAFEILMPEVWEYRDEVLMFCLTRQADPYDLDVDATLLEYDKAIELVCEERRNHEAEILGVKPHAAPRADHTPDSGTRDKSARSRVRASTLERREQVREL